VIHQDLPRVLAIVGGAGFLGRALIEALGRQPGSLVELRCIDRRPWPAGPAAPSLLSQRCGDICDLAWAREALEGCDAVWVRASLLGASDLGGLHPAVAHIDHGLEIVSSVLAACDALSIRRVFYDSAGAVFGDPFDHSPHTPEAEPSADGYYGASKLIAEKLLRYWSFRDPSLQRSVQVFRPTRVHGRASRDVLFHWVSAALDGKPLEVHGNPEHSIDFVHLDDVIAGNLAALHRNPRFAIYHASTDRPTSLERLATRVRDAVGRRTGVFVPVVNVEAGPHAVVRFEHHVVGLRWESSVRRLGLARPRSIDEMIDELVDDLHRAPQAQRPASQP